jgi:hypothetical protein
LTRVSLRDAHSGGEDLASSRGEHRATELAAEQNFYDQRMPGLGAEVEEEVIEPARILLGAASTLRALTSKSPQRAPRRVEAEVLA